MTRNSYPEERKYSILQINIHYFCNTSYNMLHKFTGNQMPYDDSQRCISIKDLVDEKEKGKEEIDGSKGEVYICGMSAQVEVPDDPEQVVGNPESIAVLKRVAETVLSHLRVGEATVKAEQACFLPCTEDSVPVIGEVPGVKACYVATGHSCWGILNGPATGAAVAKLVLDGRASIVDLSPFSLARFIGGR